ncbi:MAG: hypothetical protein ACJ73E_15725, partial [Mycobacteriales bacterium]
VAKAKQAVGRSSSGTPSSSTYPAPTTATYVTETTPGASSGDLFEPSGTTSDPLSPTNPSNTNRSNP